MTVFKFTSERVVSIRLRLGLTQAEFAQRLRVHLRTVQRWELGEGIPKQGPKIKALIDAERQAEALVPA